MNDQLPTSPETLSGAEFDRKGRNVLAGFWAQATARKLPTTGFGWFLDGLVSPFRGLALLKSTRKNLMFYLIAPIVVQTVVSSVIIGVMLLIGTGLSQVLHWLMDTAVAATTDETSETALQAEAFAHQALTVTLWIVGIVLFFFVFHIVWRMTGGIACGYFSGKLTDGVMKDRGFPQAGNNTSIPKELVSGLIHDGVLTGVGAATSLLTAIPLVGPFVGPPITVAMLCFTTGADEMRDPLRNFGLSRTQAILFCLKHRMATLGLGTARALTEPIPFIGGVARAMESLGRITLATRLMEYDKGSIEAPTTVLDESRPGSEVDTFASEDKA